MEEAAIYLRVSTAVQANDGYSLDRQRTNCTAYAEGMGFRVVREYADDISGRTLDRPGLNEMIDDIQAGIVKAVILSLPDRLSRNLLQRIILREKLFNYGIRIFYYGRGELKQDPAARFMDDIDGAVSEYEVNLIRMRTSSARREKAEQGYIVGFGLTPYGYRREGQKKNIQFVVHEPEAKIVRLIFQEYISGKKVLEIAKLLNEMNVPTYDETRPQGRQKIKGWDVSMIAKILRTETYVGRFPSFRYKRVDRKVTERPREEWLWHDVPAIISEETFHAAQVRLRTRNQRSGITRTKSDSILVGRLFCACGSRVYLHRIPERYDKTKVREYYACRLTHKGKCPAKSFRMVDVDRIVWEWLSELLEDSEKRNRTLENAAVTNSETLERLEKHLAEANARIEDCDYQTRYLLDSEIGNRFPRHIIDEKLNEVKLIRKEQEERRDILYDRILDVRLMSPESVLRAINEAEQSDNRRAIVDYLKVEVTLNWPDQLIEVRSVFGSKILEYRMI